MPALSTHNPTGNFDFEKNICQALNCTFMLNGNIWDAHQLDVRKRSAYSWGPSVYASHRVKFKFQVGSGFPFTKRFLSF